MKRVNRIFGILGAFCAAISLVIQFGQPYAMINTSYKYGKYEEIFYNIRYSLQNNFFIVTILFFMFIFLGNFLINKTLKYPKSYVFVEVLLAICWIMGKAYSVSGTLDIMMITNGQIIKSTMVMFGYLYIIHYIYKAIVLAIYSDNDIKDCRLMKLLCKYSDKHPFAFWVVMISLFAIPHALICYPGILCNDTWTQINEYLGTIQFTNHHPVMHTLIVGWCLEIGNLIGSINVGLFIYVALQVMIFVSVFAYVLYLLGKWKVKKWISVLTYCTIVLSPYFMIYSGVVIKDAIYSYFALLFVIEIIQMVVDEEFWNKKSHIVLLFLAILGTILMRNNGTYIIISTIICVLVYNVCKKKNRKILLKSGMCLIIPIVIAIGTNKMLVKMYNIGEHCVVDALSIPVQQTARYVKENEAEVTNYEKEVLNKVFDYEKLKIAYDPRISDPVKNIFRRDASNDDVKEYFKIWFKMFLKDPKVYFEATINQNYPMFYPMNDYAFVFNDTFLSKDINKMKIMDGTLSSPKPLERLKNIREYVSVSLFVLPGIGALSNYACYNLIFVVLLIIVMRRKQYKLLIPMIPIIFSDLIVLAAPVVDARYAFPLIYSVPILIGLVMKETRSEKYE